MTWAFRTWLTWAEAFGLGELALLPGQFWHLTLREFGLMREGFYRREDRAWEKVATLGVWVLAPHSKKKFTAAQLLGRHRLRTAPPAPQGEEREATDAEKAAVLAQALAWAQED